MGRDRLTKADFDVLPIGACVEAGPGAPVSGRFLKVSIRSGLHAYRSESDGIVVYGTAPTLPQILGQAKLVSLPGPEGPVFQLPDPEGPVSQEDLDYVRESVLGVGA